MMGLMHACSIARHLGMMGLMFLATAVVKRGEEAEEDLV